MCITVSVLNTRIRSIIIWPLIFQPRLDAPVKWSERTALTVSLSQCWFFLERIRNCMSSQAQTCSQAPSYSLSTKWHALLWTEVSVSVSSSDTLPGRCAALRGITYYAAHEGGIYWRWTLNSGVMFHPVPSVGEKSPISFCKAENNVWLKVHAVMFQESGLGNIYIFAIINKLCNIT